MLNWFQKNVYRKIYVWAQLIFISSIAHAALLLIMFIGYRGKDHNASLSLNRKSLLQGKPVVLFKHVAPPQIAQVAHAQTSIKEPTVVKQVIKQPQKTSVPARTVMQSQPKKVVEKKEAPAEPKEVIAKKEQPKVEEKKPPQVVKKEELPKPIEKKVEQKNVAKKETPKLAIVKNDIPSKIPADKKVPVQPINALSDNASTHTASAPQIDGPIIVARDYREKVLIKKHQQLQQELVRVWHPPVGMQQECACHMRVTVGSDGVVRKVNVVDSSGILMFDVAARSALCSAQLPKWTWGTSFDITFS